MTKTERLDLLKKYKEKVLYWNQHHDQESRSFLNQKLAKVRMEIARAGCFQSLTISPPPAIGGYIMQDVDPLVTMFDPPYLMNLTKTVIDMIDQTIGVIDTEDDEWESASISNEVTFQKGYVFVAMPINKSDPSLDDVLDAIKTACGRLGLVAERVDEFQNNEKITDNILEGIQKAEFVIADLTYSKPNVYYEAGYAHALKKTPVYIAREGTKFEFDVKDYPVIIFNSMRVLKEELEKRLMSITESHKKY